MKHNLLETLHSSYKVTKHNIFVLTYPVGAVGAEQALRAARRAHVLGVIAALSGSYFDYDA
jgi:hypothetical protein